MSKRNKPMIVVECDPDEFLIKSLGFSRKIIKHESGKGDVLRIMKKNQMKIGIIDEDPHSSQPKELNNYQKKEYCNSITLLEKKDNSNKQIIQISPYLEHWLIDRARQNQISLKEFGLPKDPKELHDIPHIERNPNFQSFLNKLINTDNEINKIKEWIHEVTG